MKALFIGSAMALLACSAGAQTCEQATRNYQVSNGARVRNQEMVDMAYRDAQRACGVSGGQAQQVQQPQYAAPTRIPPGSLINCDAAGCWGASNSVRYNRVAGGNLQGTDGSFCSTADGRNFSCR